MSSSEQEWAEQMEKNNRNFPRMKRGRGAARPGKGNQAMVEEKKSLRDIKFPLKSGEYNELGWTRNWEERLRHLSETHPDHFRALHSLVEGRNEHITDRQLRDLKSWLYLGRDGSPLPDVTLVMKAAYRESQDGPCLVDPLAVESPAEAAIVERFEKERDRVEAGGIKRILNHLSKRDKGEGKGQLG